MNHPLVTPERRKRILNNLLGKVHGKPIHKFVCDSCALNQAYLPVSPPESGNQNWLCGCCGHFGVGSTYDCIYGDWLYLWILDEEVRDRA